MRLIVGIIALLLLGAAQGQDYPARPIHPRQVTRYGVGVD